MGAVEWRDSLCFMLSDSECDKFFRLVAGNLWLYVGVVGLRGHACGFYYSFAGLQVFEQVVLLFMHKYFCWYVLCFIVYVQLVLGHVDASVLQFEVKI